MGERISDETGKTGADRSLFVGVIISRVALRVRAAWIRIAQILWNGTKRDYSYLYVSLIMSVFAGGGVDKSRPQRLECPN